MPVDPIQKSVLENQKQILVLQKENKELKKILKSIERKLNLVADKIQEFEVVFDAAQIIEDEVEKQQEYNTEWNPYDDEDYTIEDYEDYDSYDDDDDDEDDVIRGY